MSGVCSIGVGVGVTNGGIAVWFQGGDWCGCGGIGTGRVATCMVQERGWVRLCRGVDKGGLFLVLFWCHEGCVGGLVRFIPSCYGVVGCWVLVCCVVSMGVSVVLGSTGYMLGVAAPFFVGGSDVRNGGCVNGAL